MGGRIAKQARSENSKKLFQIFKQKANEVGGTSERVGGAGGGMPGTQGRRGAFERETRSVDCSDGGEDERAEGSARRLSEADFPGVERAGGAEDKKQMHIVQLLEYGPHSELFLQRDEQGSRSQKKRQARVKKQKLCGR